MIALALLCGGCATNDRGGEFYTDWDREGACQGLRTQPWGISLGGTALGPCVFPGRLVWIVYDALWCQSCRQQRSEARTAYRAGAGGAVFLGVLGGGTNPGAAASDAQVRAWAGELGFDPRQLVSEGVTPRTVPQHALIGPDGRTWFRHLGVLSATQIDTLLDEFRAGRRQPGYLER